MSVSVYPPQVLQMSAFVPIRSATGFERYSTLDATSEFSGSEETPETGETDYSSDIFDLELIQDLERGSTASPVNGDDDLIEYQIRQRQSPVEDLVLRHAFTFLEMLEQELKFLATNSSHPERCRIGYNLLTQWLSWAQPRVEHLDREPLKQRIQTMGLYPLLLNSPHIFSVGSGLLKEVFCLAQTRLWELPVEFQNSVLEALTFRDPEQDIQECKITL